MGDPAAEVGLSVRLKLGKPPTIEVSGQTINVIKREQLDSLLHGYDDLEGRVRRYRPGPLDGVHLSDQDGLPGNLRGTFSKYGWTPAQLHLQAKSARIVDVTSQPVIVDDQLSYNPSDIDSEQSAEISAKVTNSVTRESHWDVSATVEQTVSYEIGGDAYGGKVGGSTSLSFTGGYGESTGKTESVEISTTGSVKALLKPHGAVLFQLSMALGTINAQVTYEARLQGGVFYHYGKRVDGHYLWYVPLSALYGAADLVKEQNESLSVKVYGHKKIIQSDPPAGWQEKLEPS